MTSWLKNNDRSNIGGGMSSDIKIDYDCGFSVVYPTVLRQNETLLHNYTLADSFGMLADIEHDMNCASCQEVSDE
jgi:hypothetical protein